MSLELATRYREIRSKIGVAAGSPEKAQSITLIAVSKLQPMALIEALYALGHRDFGENYVQELARKSESLAKRGCTDLRWHLIGHLQTNKVKQGLAHASSVHSVDSPKLAAELARRWRESKRSGGAPFPVFIEVNIDEESSKSGVLPSAVRPLAEEISHHRELSLQGLMAIPEPGHTPEQSRVSFSKLRELERGLRAVGSLGKLSMGMSDDYEIAVQEGATHVRVGTALFGRRA
ncbi:MAG: YggS family pyridoxal phosphate-dependent enzyme [Bdellovibrionota bacterium]